MRLRGVEQSLLLAIGFHQRNLLRLAPGSAQIIQCGFVHGEDAARRAIFRRHVGDGGAIGQRQPRQSRPKEFHKLAHYAGLAQDLRHSKHQVSGRGAFTQLPCQFEPDHLRQQHGNRLPQHGCLGFNAAHAPAQHPQAVDHGGVGIRSYQRVWISHAYAVALF